MSRRNALYLFEEIAPHVHSLLWLKNESNEDAPNFWSDEEAKQCSSDESRKRKVEAFADSLITTSADDIRCEKHEMQDINHIEIQRCKDCNELIFKVPQSYFHR